MANPFPFVANTVLTAAQLNGIGEASTSYTPTWSSSGVAPVLGNGTITGKYQQVNKLVFAQIFLTIGTTTVVGTGNYTFTLPVTGIASPGSGPMISAGLYYDASASAAYNIQPALNNTTTTMRVFVFANASQTFAVLSATSPVIPASTDEISLLFIYQAA